MYKSKTLKYNTINAIMQTREEGDQHYENLLQLISLEYYKLLLYNFKNITRDVIKWRNTGWLFIM